MDIQDTVKLAAEEYLSACPFPAGRGLSQDQAVSVKTGMLQSIYAKFEAHNAMCAKDEKWRKPPMVTHDCIGRAVLHFWQVRLIDFSDGYMDADVAAEHAVLGVYQADGPYQGTYRTSPQAVNRILGLFYPGATEKEIGEVTAWIRRELDPVCQSDNPDLVAVNNGIFHCRTKELLPFSPEHVFLTKCPVDYVAQAPLPVLHNDADQTDWDPEGWMASLSDDPGVPELLWQSVGAVIRPGVRWDKSLWLYSDRGNNGKGTLCELMRSLCGRGNYASISIEDFGGSNQFVLEPLMHSSAVIVDENNVGVYVDRSKDLKAAVTGDVIQINRKYKAPVSYRFRGFMVQCLNDLPRIRDRSESFLRRCLFVPMNKCFTGQERKYIKHDYLHRREVLEYVLCRVLNMDYYELSEPAACKSALNDYRAYNNPIQAFVDDTFHLFVWDLVPYSFLYDLYKAWFRENNPQGSPVGNLVFRKELKSVMQRGGCGFVPALDNAGRDAQVRVTKTNMQGAETLIWRYRESMKSWMAPRYSGMDPMQACLPRLSSSYRGILRVKGAVSGTGPSALPVTEDGTETG